MKKFKISVFGKIVRKGVIYLAKTVLKKQNPQVIGITSSSSEASTKNVVAHLLENEFSIRQAYGNQNAEIGLSLAILGIKSIDKSIIGVIGICRIFLREFTSKSYPQILILEYGVDSIGDMDSLLEIAKPTVAVVTEISSTYYEFFDNLNEIAIEKSKLARAVVCSNNNEICGVVLNGDDSSVMKVQKDLICPTYIYSTNKKTTFYSTGVHLNFHDDVLHGISFKINYNGNSVPIRLLNVIAVHQIYPILAAITVASIYKMNMIDIAQKLQSYKPPVSRMTYLEGINNSMIIDDTFNASLESTESAIDSLSNIKAMRKIAILGDILELGKISDEGHEKIVKKIASKKIDFVIFVGDNFKIHKDILLEKDFILDENLFFCDSPIIAKRIIYGKIRKNDLILVKGSQGMRMEKVVEEIIGKNVNLNETVCRQNNFWKNVKFSK